MAKPKSSEGRPSDEEISQRAYELYLQRGSLPGHETDDWLQAEAELIEARRNAEEAFNPGSTPGAGAPAPESRRNSTRRENPTATRRTLRQ
jgi:Protein of unknown function (DUF2934)